jgi:CTP-dependent riboflavin kinase
MPTTADDTLDSLVLDLLEWIAKEPRSYRQTMEAWRTSCPRLAVWEEALDRGFVVRERAADGTRVAVTEKGSAFLVRCGRANCRPPSRIAAQPLIHNGV